MNRIALRWLGNSFVVAAAAALAAACADGESTSVVSPEQQQQQQPPALHRAAKLDLEGCEQLAAPAGSVQSAHAYAKGVQIYRWDGSAWGFVAPSAVLFEDRKGRDVIGIHFAGPNWQANDGSKVAAAVKDRCTPNANAIPWLLLTATPTSAAGIFQGTVAIQRVNTEGGLAPSTPGTVAGEERLVPYTAEYYFYR